MTSQLPPPPSESGFPPPASAQAYAPPPEGFAHGPAPTAGPAPDSSNYTPWFTRVLAYVIDVLPVSLLVGIGAVALPTFQKVETICISEICATGNNGPSLLAWSIFAVTVLLALVFSLWNHVVRQGNTGSSIGKQIMNFKVVDEQTQQPIGAGKSFVRQIAHAVDGLICYIGFLFPLWDAKRQTIADKLMKTVCVPS